MKNFIGNILIITGLLCFLLAVLFVYERVNPRRVSFAYGVQAESKKTESKHKPTGIIIPAVSISLPIFPSVIRGSQWEATTEGVSYLKSSPVPGEIGNSILYGHNWTNLLGPLVYVKPGDEIEIVYDDKTKKIFEVEYTVTVTPDQVHILEGSNDKRITLYTCTGFLDSKRFVVVGIFKEAASAEEIVKLVK